MGKPRYYACNPTTGVVYKGDDRELLWRLAAMPGWTLLVTINPEKDA